MKSNLPETENRVQSIVSFIKMKVNYKQTQLALQYSLKIFQDRSNSLT